MTVPIFFSKHLKIGSLYQREFLRKTLKTRAVVNLDMSGSKEKGVKNLTPDKFSFSLGEARKEVMKMSA